VRGAAEVGGESALITFEPHPRCVLDPANCPSSITTLREKLDLVEQAGVDHAIVLRFDRDLAGLSPQEFIDRLSSAMEIRLWVIGFDFAFGRGRTGNVEWLRAHDHDVVVVPPFRIDGRDLHSSEIRRLVTAGEVHEANRLLGRDYSLSGPVEAGARVGRQLGFPTANISPEPNKLVPALGAYAGRVLAPEGRFVAALSVGYRPTFGGTELKVEAFLLDFEGDLYQQRLELRFVRYLHPDIKFGSSDDLVRQLQQDVADTRQIVGR
jgi:riboflavin kinase/FMN adenylyltransferase